MVNIKLKYGFSCCALLVIIVGQGLGQRSWENKSYKQWTLSETTQLLTDSPWAQTQHERVRINYGLPANSYVAIIRLRSALPTRQAVVRQRMLFVKYDRLSVTDQAKFDSEVREFLDCRECVSNYIVTLGSPKVSVQPDSVGFDIVWSLRNLSLDEIKRYVQLTNEKGEKRDLIRFTPPKREGSEAMFVFQRFDGQRKALLTLSNTTFYFKIDEKVFERRSVPLKRFAFEVSKLVRDGAIVF